ncbi:MAG TPA: SCO family protein [Methylococcaceae bacterium]|nr:SCO family protein [Methylococcaceae bacterium]
MKSRREFLAAGAAVLPALALSAYASGGSGELVSASADNLSANACKKLGGASAKYFPNPIVMTHEGRKAWFYDDLIKGKIVGINFMSVQKEDKFPVTRNLASTQELLGDKLGRDVFLVSVTTDPDRDTPLVLEKFAKAHGAKEGWIFVTGKSSDMQALYHKLGSHHGHGAMANHHIWRYGNEPYARWATSHALARPHQLAQRLSWVEVRENPSSPTAQL